MKAKMQFSDWKVKWKNSKCPSCESMEKQLNSSGIFSQDFRRCRFFKRSKMICENGTSNLRDSQTGSSSCHCSTTSIGQRREMMEFVFRIQKSQGIREFTQGHWTCLGPGDYSHSNVATIQRYRSSSTQENQRFEWWNSEKEEWQGHHTLQCGCFEHHDLVPNHSFCKSAQYLPGSFESV